MLRTKRLPLLLVAIALVLTGFGPAQAAAPNPPSPEVVERQFAVQVALGKESPTLILRGATVLDTYTKTWLPYQDVVLAGKRIAFVGPVGTYSGKVDPKNIVNLIGYTIVPSFCEGHNHIESYNATPDVVASVILNAGVTCIMEAGHELGNVLTTPQNIDFWKMAGQAGSPVTINMQAGSAVPPTGYEHTSAVNDYATMSKAYEDASVVAFDEVMNGPGWQDPGNPSYTQLWGGMAATWESNHIVSGHLSRQYGWAQYQSGAAAGFNNDHELSQPDEALRKLQAGINVFVRPGNINVLLPGLLRLGLKEWSHVALTTDDRNIADAVALGTINGYVKTAIALGVPTIEAYMMGSTYPTQWFHLERDFGAVAPGRYADLVVLRGDPKDVDIYRVYAKGELWSENGKLTKDVPKVNWPSWATSGAMKVREVTAADFQIKAPAGKTTVTAALWQQFWYAPPAVFITTTLSVQDGIVQPDSAQQVVEYCMVDRYNNLKQPVACMFAKNIGPSTPDTAFGLTEAHDSHNIQVLANTPEAAALAVNELRRIGGGYVLVSGGKVVDEVVLEVGGLMTARPAAESAKDFTDFWASVATMKWFTTVPLDSPAYNTTAMNALQRQRFAPLTCTPWGDVLVAPWEDCTSGYRNVQTGECKPVVQ